MTYDLEGMTKSETRMTKEIGMTNSERKQSLKFAIGCGDRSTKPTRSTSADSSFGFRTSFVIRVSGFVILLLGLSGCGGEGAPKAIVDARKAMQLDKPQAAIDALSADPADDTPEGHYLRAVAFDRMERAEAAKAETQIAIEKAPKVVKYSAFAQRLKMFNGDEKAIDSLLELHEANPSSAAVSFHAVFAYQAKHVRLRTAGKLRAARVQLEKAQVAIKVALSLAAEIPEFHRELIAQSLWFEQPEDSLKLVEALLKDNPNDEALQRDKIKVLMLAKQSAETIRAAAELYRQLERTEAAAMEFAMTLHRLPASPATVEQFEMLRDAYPANMAILVRHCWTLGRGGRTKDACELLNAELSRHDKVSEQRLLGLSAISIPLELNEPDLAEAQFTKHRDLIGEGAVREYFAGRLAVLQKHEDEGLKHLQAVITSYQTGGKVSRDLVGATLTAIQQLSNQEQLADHVRKAAELTLRRAGLSRRDEDLLRDEAKSLLNLLEIEAPVEPTDERK